VFAKLLGKSISRYERKTSICKKTILPNAKGEGRRNSKLIPETKEN